MQFIADYVLVAGDKVEFNAREFDSIAEAERWCKGIDDTIHESIHAGELELPFTHTFGIHPEYAEYPVNE